MPITRRPGELAGNSNNVSSSYNPRPSFQNYSGAARGTGGSGYSAAPVAGLGGLGYPSFQQALSQYQGLMGPQFAQLDLQQANQRNQIAQLQAQFQQASNFAHQNNALANRGLALDMQGINLARQANEKDIDYYNRIIQMLSENYQRQVGQTTRANELFNKDIGRKVDYTFTVEDLVNRLFNTQQSARKTQYGREQSDQTSDAVARGALGATGHGDRLDFLRNMFQSDLNQMAIGNEQDVAGIREQRGALEQAYQEGLLGFEKQFGDLAYAFNRENASLWKERDANQDERAMLDLKAKELGLKRDQLAAQLSQGLAQLGLQRTISVNDLMTGLASGDIQKQILAQQVIQAAVQVAGPPPPSNPANQSSGGSYVKRGKAF